MTDSVGVDDRQNDEAYDSDIARCSLLLTNDELLFRLSNVVDHSSSPCLLRGNHMESDTSCRLQWSA